MKSKFTTWRYYRTVLYSLLSVFLFPIREGQIRGGGKGFEISLGLPRDLYRGERKVTPSFPLVSPLFPPYSPKRAVKPSFAIRRFYNESLFTGLSIQYLCCPILRRRASNWNFPKRDSAPSQPLALARFFSIRESSVPTWNLTGMARFVPAEHPRAVWRNLYAPLHTYIHAYIPIYVYVDSLPEG